MLVLTIQLGDMVTAIDNLNKNSSTTDGGSYDIRRYI
jgi:hypothetical protein